MLHDLILGLGPDSAVPGKDQADGFGTGNRLMSGKKKQDNQKGWHCPFKNLMLASLEPHATTFY
jgi:hypothetical protein